MELTGQNRIWPKLLAKVGKSKQVGNIERKKKTIANNKCKFGKLFLQKRRYVPIYLSDNTGIQCLFKSE